MLPGVVGCAGLLAVWGVVARRRFSRRIDREAAALLSAAGDAERARITEADLEALPEPVQRWLRRSGVVGTTMPTSVHLRQEGMFRLGENQPWMPFRAEQSFAPRMPGFIWNAAFMAAPLVSIVGRDRYQAGVGDIDMRLLGIIPVARKRGGGLNQGALHRYLGEIVWFPAAALSDTIVWEPIDAMSAQATIRAGGETAAAVFVFDADGRPERLEADRYNDARGAIEPWSIPIMDYGTFGGIEIPVAGEGVWHYETGDFAYIRWRITALEQDVRGTAQTSPRS